MTQISILQAGRAWPILVSAAATEERVLTYKEVAEAVGTAPRALGHALEHIQKACDARNAPPLSALVVGIASGVPGAGFRGGRDEETIAKVRSQDWSLIPNPFPINDERDVEMLVDDMFDGRIDAGEVYRRTRQRGGWQTAFRKGLLRAYEGRCAFCGFGFHEALDAAHIVPWMDLAETERAHPSSGILLCSNHHKLFDHGLLRIDVGFSIQFRDPDETDGGYLEADRAASSSLHGRKIRLPEDARWHPRSELLSRSV